MNADIDAAGSGHSSAIGALGNTITGGIQDISALLPLLGTEQCETHIGSALSQGWLYAAATPMSIFGSLGIARAGFKTLLAGGRPRKHSAPGSSKIQDSSLAGPTFLSSCSVTTRTRNQHLAEIRLQKKIDDLHIEDARALTVTSHCGLWNFYCSFPPPFSAFWLSPPTFISTYKLRKSMRNCTLLQMDSPQFTRLGGFLTATMIQIVIQRRLLTIVKSRLIFMALDRQVKISNLALQTSDGMRALPRRLAYGVSSNSFPVGRGGELKW